MKKQFIWIHGLPGSGKSFLANKIKSENTDFALLDDIANISQIKNIMEDGENIILTSPYFESYLFRGNNFLKLNQILEGNNDYELTEYWFENNPKACIDNLKNRQEHHIKSDSIIGEIYTFSKNYNIPKNVEVIPVYQKMKHLKYFENFNSNYDYDMILRIMKKTHGWGNGCYQYFDDFENDSNYFNNPEDSSLYANQFHVYLTDLQNGRLRGQFHKVPSGLRPGVWKMSIPVYKPATIQKYL
jgi:hypothetical protein